MKIFHERRKGELLYFSGVGFISRINFMFLLYSLYDPKPEMILDDDDEWKIWEIQLCAFSSLTLWLVCSHFHTRMLKKNV